MWCGGYLLSLELQHREIDSLAEKVTVSVDTTTEQQSEEEAVQVPVDFEALKEINTEIYAWINIPGTNINYPILRSETDNAYYLTHKQDGKKSVYGAIYTEDYNSMDFSDFNTVIYGHNMKNGTMFGSLKKFKNKTFFNENRYIEIYMPDRILRYEIFAACSRDNKHILAENDFDTADGRTAYINEVLSTKTSGALFADGVAVTADDKIITLSTCMNDDSKRFTISAVLIYDSDNI